MPQSSKSTVVENPQPENIFYIWYGELCRRINASPLSIVKPAKPKKDTVLDFVGDRIKADEWKPILKALASDTSLHVIAIRNRVNTDFLHDADTEQKVKQLKRRFGVLCTDYILKQLLKSLTCCLKNSTVLSTLELDGLYIDKDYLQYLLNGLQVNSSIRNLSLKHCPIKDDGCEILCNTLHFIPNIEVLNLSDCSLSTLSAKYLSKLVTFQQLQRYCECWHNSLRYEEPEVEIMCGLRRLTLNNNPDIGDEGLGYILDVLTDDLWIKAIDMQNCNITDNMARRITDTVDYSRSLQVADFRRNQLSREVMDKVLDILKSKELGYDSEYQWCLTTTTLPFTNSLHEGISSRTVNIPNLYNTKSVTTQQPNQSIVRTTNSTTPTLRRTKTMANIPRNSSQTLSRPKSNLNQAKNQVLELNSKLQEEMAKRRQVEQANQELKNKLEQIKSATGVSFPSEIGHCLQIFKDLSHKKSVSSSRIKSTSSKPTVKVSVAKERKETKVKRTKNSAKTGARPIKFVFSPRQRDSAQNIFAKMLSKENIGDGDPEVFNNMKGFKSESNMANYIETEGSLSDMTASNVSLLRFVEEIKNSDINSEEASTSRSVNSGGDAWVAVR